MNANRIAKESQVKEIVEKFNASEAVVVAEYAGLTVKETQALRAQLKEKGVEFKVYKNRLFKIAAEQAGFGDLNTELTGPNAFAFGMEDGISPAKVLADFAKKHEALKIKAGTFEGKVVDLEELKVIATLPTYEEALTMLAMSMLAPIKYVGSGLHMLTEGDALTAAPAEAEAPKAEEAPAEEVKEEVAQEAATEEAPAQEAAAEETKEEAPAAEAEEAEEK